MLIVLMSQVNPNPDSSNIQLAAYMAYVILPLELACYRDEILSRLMSEFKVDARRFFSRLSTMPCYQQYETVSRLGCGMPCIEAEKVQNRGFSLPTSAYMSQIHKVRVVSAIKALVKTQHELLKQ